MQHQLAAVAVAERTEPEHRRGQPERVAHGDQVERRLRRVESLADRRAARRSRPRGSGSRPPATRISEIRTRLARSGADRVAARLRHAVRIADALGSRRPSRRVRTTPSRARADVSRHLRLRRRRELARSHEGYQARDPTTARDRILAALPTPWNRTGFDRRHVLGERFSKLGDVVFDVVFGTSGSPCSCVAGDRGRGQMRNVGLTLRVVAVRMAVQSTATSLARSAGGFATPPGAGSLSPIGPPTDSSTARFGSLALSLISCLRSPSEWVEVVGNFYPPRTHPKPAAYPLPGARSMR